MKVEFDNIGTIYSPFTELECMPIQPTGAKGVKGEIHIKDEYVSGLKDVDGFSHLILIYHFHKTKGSALEIKPFMDGASSRGVFATRSPKRPNNIGLSTVKLEKVEGNVLHISNVDILNGTPLLDMKPYVPQLFEDTIDELKIGWLETKHNKAKNQKSDDRFID